MMALNALHSASAEMIGNSSVKWLQRSKQCVMCAASGRSNSYTGRCAPGLRLLELGSGLAGEAPSHIEDMFKRAI